MATVKVPLKVLTDSGKGTLVYKYVYDEQKTGLDKKVYVEVETDKDGNILGTSDPNRDQLYSVGNLNNGAYYEDGTRVPELGSGDTYTKYYIEQFSKPNSSPVYSDPTPTPSRTYVNYYYTISDGYIYVAATTTGGGSTTASRTGYANFKQIGANVSGTGVGSYVSSRNENEYPRTVGGAKSGNYWYTFTISDQVDPTLVVISDNDGILRPGIDTITITITESTAATLKSYGTVEYEYYYSVDNGATWINIETTSETTIDFEIPAEGDEGEELNYLIVGVKFKDNIGYIGDMIMTENMALTNNMPPIISDIDRDLGELTSYLEDRPKIVYRVWDEDYEEIEVETDDGGTAIVQNPTDVVTVTEYVDDIKTNSFSFKGITETLFSFPDSIWLTLLNGPHTMKIIAQDDKGNVTTRTYTFTKAIDEISVMFEEPMESLEAMYLAVEEMVAELPTGAQVWVYVCNDGFDEHPTWQDATVEVRNGTKIYITNAGIWDGKEPEEMTPGYKWGYNVWVRIKRGTAEGPVYLTSLDGHWK